MIPRDLDGDSVTASIRSEEASPTHRLSAHRRLSARTFLHQLLCRARPRGLQPGGRHASEPSLPAGHRDAVYLFAAAFSWDLRLVGHVARAAESIPVSVRSQLDVHAAARDGAGP